METMTVEQAKERGALGVFEEKYAKLGSQVKVYSIGNQQDGFVSVEVCGGPHVENTSVLGHFTILKEEAVSAGVRRIKAVLEKSP
jgi:alanyl-tRNA synthetase